MMDLDDSQVCRQCGAYSGGNGWCANLPGHPFEEPVTIAEYVRLHPQDKAAAEYLRSRNEEQQQQAAAAPTVAAPSRMQRDRAEAVAAEWKRVLGEPASARRVPRPDVDEGTDPELMEYGGGPSFDDVYTTALLDWTFEWRNVGRHDGHMASLVVLRNETGLPWTDGWTTGDEALEAVISAAMTDLDRDLDQSLRPAARAPVPDTAAVAPAAPIAFDPFDSFTE